MDDHNYHEILEANTESFNSSNFDCTNEGLKYVAGYLAHTFRMKYPALGAKSSECSQNHFEIVSAPWIRALSRGGLMVPTAHFYEKICQFEKMFSEFHGENICREKKVVATLALKICHSHQEIPEDVIKKFVKTRTFIRIKFLNHQLQAKAESARARNSMKQRHFQR